jgi:hypothetical protein
LGVLIGNARCGRKFCTLCGRWRHIVDFHVATWRDDQAVALQARCMTCCRIKTREKKGHQPRRWGACKRGHPRTPENTLVVRDAAGYDHRQCKVCRREDYRAKMAAPEFVERRREYNRFWAEGRRRRAGVQPRPLFAARAPDHEQTPKLPVEPFRLWLERLLPRYGSLRNMAEALRVDESLLGHTLAGRKKYVLLTTVDKALTNEGNTLWWELYPDDDMAEAA